MIRPFLGKKGIFVFSDPAGAKACLALASELFNENIFVISDRIYSFYSDFNVKVNIFHEENFSDLFDIYLPDYVFTGTSIPEKIEIKFLKKAKNNKIFTYSFVDHWIHIKERFKTNESYFFPDQIWVLDKNALQIAINDGIPSELLHISGNPYNNYLKSWKPLISKEEILTQLGLHVNARYILYAPEPITTFNLQDKYGYTELNGLIHLYKYLNQSKRDNLYIVVKGHPNQNDNLFLDFLKEVKNDRIIYVKDINLNELIFYSEVVIGYFSNSMIEAQIISKNVIRILIDLSDKTLDPFLDKNIGSIANSELELFSKINLILG